MLKLHTVVHYEEIKVTARQRTEIKPSELAETKESILKHGLFHAPMVHLLEDDPDFKYKLVIGGRRLRAITELYKENPNLQYKFGDATMQNGLLPANVVSNRSLSELMQMELEENTVRVDLQWQDRVNAIAAIHKQLTDEATTAGEKQTVTATAKVIHDKLGGEAASPLAQQTLLKHTRAALALAPLLDNRPDLNRAKTAHDAYKIVIREEHDRFQRQLAVIRMSKAAASARLWQIDHVDLRKAMPSLEGETVDLILVDPPYGINLHKEKYAATTYHRYDDSPQASIDLSIFILQEGWRVAKPQANLFMFCKGKHFQTLLTAAGQYGWRVWYEPLIWQKSKAEGEAPWGRLGFIHTYETFLFATKGQKGIHGPTPDTFEFAKVGARARQHGAEKPVKLFERLIELATIPNDLVLDPCLGIGTTSLAATRLRRRSIGFELDQTYYDRAIIRMMNYEQGKLDDDITFDDPVESGEPESGSGVRDEVGAGDDDGSNPSPTPGPDGEAGNGGGEKEGMDGGESGRVQ